MTLRRAVALLLPLFALAHCSDNQPPFNAETTKIKSLCEALDEHAKTCGGTVDRAACEKDGEFYECAFNAASLDLYFQCRASGDCSDNSSDGVCASKAIVAKDEKKPGACTDKAKLCVGTPDEWSTSICNYPVYRTDIRNGVDSCLDKGGTCAQIKACLAPQLDAITGCRK